MFVGLLTVDPASLKREVFDWSGSPLLNKLHTRFHPLEPLWVWKGEWVLGCEGLEGKARKALEIDPALAAIQVLQAVIQIHGKTLFTHPLEKAAVLKAAERLLAGEELPLDFLSLLGEPPHAKRLKELRELISMETALQEILVQKEIPLKTLLMLCHWPLTGQQCLAKHFETSLPVTVLAVNKIREYCEGIQEAAMARHSTPLEVMDRMSAQCPALGETNLDFNTRKKWLQEEAHPELAQWRKKLEGQAKRLRVPGGMSLDLPDNMEGSQIRAAIHFRTPEELKKWGEELIKISGRADLAEISSIL